MKAIRAPVVSTSVRRDLKAFLELTFSVGAAYYAKLRWQRTRGVALGTDRIPTPEDIRDSIQRIQDFTNASNPSKYAELRSVVMASNSDAVSSGQESMMEILSHLNEKSSGSSASTASSSSESSGGIGGNSKTAPIYTALESQVKGRGAELVKQVLRPHSSLGLYFVCKLRCSLLEVNGVFIFEITGNPAETWVLDLKSGSGSLTKGAPETDPKGANLV